MECAVIGSLVQAQDCHSRIPASTTATHSWAISSSQCMPVVGAWRRQGQFLMASIPSPGTQLCQHTHAQSGDLESAKLLFDQMWPRNVISWTAIVADYSHSGHIAEAEAIFQRMLHDTIVGNAMVTAYAHHWHLREAFTIFDTMPVMNDFSWNLMLQAFTVNSSPEDAPHFFESVSCRNVVSWNALLAAVAQRGRLAEASRTFEMMPQLELASWNTIITAFATPAISPAGELFATMPEFDIISWNTLIAGYAENGSYKTAVELFRELNLEGPKPTESTFVGLLIGCNCGELTSTSCR
ncbi:pentatricopeptide repeat-containing protein At2g35030, mitochondrial-like [Selaginella moellendorffii]|uniref:pentatricopeptide repeat-containing protein At2g35030, mitochondrial-like n=1 Tax=Selaginella moellendorffii TaxID=88036 RepID=UPI000D1CE8F5|nr:pentatricopeptide repeat-containing protein At2g35030, mitochondrial-like [Selaginella moellendorffii]|eukprot:XP_024536039.1 pentatricopeptide repeat-containing protein At2g35030, mitochondrial-like [Selaginella moellendorffii]